MSSPRESEHPSQDNFNIRASNLKKGGVKLIIDDSLVSPPSTTPKGDEKEVQPPSSKTPKGDGRESLEEILPESPSHRNGKDMAKSILKHAGRSARELKHSLSRKIRKPKGDMPVESDSTDDESLSSSVDSAVTDAGLAVSSSAASPPTPASDDHSLKLKDDVETENLPGGNYSEPGDRAVPASDMVL